MTYALVLGTLLALAAAVAALRYYLAANQRRGPIELGMKPQPPESFD